MNLIDLFLLTHNGLFLVVNSIVESTDFMRETGKIHVVYGVITIIFIGITLFLVYLERKISKIEKKINND